MKRYTTKVLLGLVLCQAAWGGISSNYVNYGTVTSPPVVDALSFLNTGVFEVNTPANGNLTNIVVFEEGNSSLPYATQDTLYYTNTGIMTGFPGFEFSTGTATNRRSASIFFNDGFIEGIDGLAPLVPVIIDGFPQWYAAEDQPTPSQVLVSASNIINSGAMSVGDYGLLSLTGSNVTSAYGSLAAGIVGTVGLTNYVQDITGLQGQVDIDDFAVNGTYYAYYNASPSVYDVSWGTNALVSRVDVLSDELEDLTTNTPVEVDEFEPTISLLRGELEAILPCPINLENGQWSVTAYLYTGANSSNIYYDIVLVNTNFANTNITATVAAYFPLGYEQVGANLDLFGFENIVQFAEPVYDVITGQTVTNGIYLIDDGAVNSATSAAFGQNSSVADDYKRPIAFEVTTVTPPEWEDLVLEAPGFVSAFGYDPAAIYSAGVFNNNTETIALSQYGAQIGRNPSQVDGSFSSLLETNSLDYDVVNEDFHVNLPDPTNDPARIEISADNLNVTQTRMRAEGMVILNVTNLIGGGNAVVDFGEANATIGVSNSMLNISNVFPTTFKRIRGDIYAWSASWENNQTNSLPVGGFVITGTNTWHYHVTIVDQNLFGTFTPTVRNLTLTGTNSIVLQDNLNVINQAVINTTNLTIESSNYFSQGAQNFTPTTTPRMKNLFINTNGFLGAANVLDVGYNQTQGQAAPGGRAYTVNTITNFGQMISAAPLLQSAIFENDGKITANTGGSILIEASNLSMGLVLTNVTNSLIADGSTDLSGISMQIRNSVISNGMAEPGSLTLDATAQLTDFVPGTATTNTNSVIINHWTVTRGFSLPVKPVTGDLYGTEIHTIATGQQYVTHTWAATDWSNNIAKGFIDNEVIGRLVLDRVSNSATLHFSAAGVKNAMYVDFLELTNYAYSDYRTGLAIDPNFTIYFADSNFDPQKLQEIYPNLVWVTNFVGPNSVQVVPYTNSSIVCLMNAAVANSGEIAFWNSIPNYNFLQTYGPYLLNGPFGTNFMDCPGTYTFPCNCTPGTNEYQVVYTNGSRAGGASNLVVLTVSYDGQGSVSPTLTASQLTLGNSYTLTATPATGWVFDSWTTAMNGNLITSYSNKLTVAFVTNTVVTAYFIPVPFPAEAGAYNGLFYQTNGVEPGSSGAVSLSLTKSGGLSGKLTIGSTNYSFSAQFSGSGAAQFKTTSGAQSLTVNLQLDITNQIGQIFGEVSNASWNGSAVLLANLTPTWTSKNPSPLAGSYTMSLPWSTGTVVTPGGDSYGAGTVSPQGVLTLAGALSDGSTFSESAPVSSGGQWPFYVYSASGKDSVLGWVTVSNGLTATSVVWSKAPRAGPLYAAGFTNQLQMIGSTWQTPLSPRAAVLSVTNPSVVLSGGNLPESTLSIPVKSQNSLTFAATNANVSIKSSTGVFTGWFEPLNTNKKITISGVVLMNTNSALGFFLGTNESGTALLEGQ